jgi:hypothetical protein
MQFSSANSFTDAEALTPRSEVWDVQNTMKLCEEGQESVFQGKVPLMESVHGVRAAVAQLNSGELKCPQGFCAVRSQQGGCYLLFRRDAHAAAMNALGLAANPSAAVTPSRSTSDRKASCPTSELRQGSCVTIKGLTKLPEFNGQRGVCVQFSAENQCWLIRLESGEETHLKLENIEAVEADGQQHATGVLESTHVGRPSPQSAVPSAVDAAAVEKTYAEKITQDEVARARKAALEERARQASPRPSTASTSMISSQPLSSNSSAVSLAPSSSGSSRLGLPSPRPSARTSRSKSPSMLARLGNARFSGGKLVI